MDLIIFVIKSHALKALQSKTGKQTILLFASQIAMVIIGFGIKTIQTNYLGTEGYGIYAFFGSFTAFTALFFRFGFYSSLQVLLAENKDFQKEQELFALGFVINLFIGLLYAVFVWIFSFYIDQLFDTTLGDIIRVLAPLTIVIPTRSLISSMTIGSNKVHILPIYDNTSKIFFLIALGLFAYSKQLDVYTVISFNLLTLLVSLGIIYRQFNPQFKNLKTHFKSVWAKNKSFGFNFYLGSTVNQSTFKLDELAIVYFINTTVNGFYSLANLIASPMIMGSQALSNSLFKDFSHQKKIPQKVFVYNTLWLLFSMLFLYLFADWIVSFLFTSEFGDVSKYAVGISVALLFQGLYQPFNFLSAKSQGKAIRNVAFTEAGINLIGNLALIPIFGVLGAIYTSIFAKFAHLLGKIYYYNKYLKEN